MSVLKHVTALRRAEIHVLHWSCTCCTALRFPPRADKGAAFIAGIAIDSLNEFIYVSHLQLRTTFPQQIHISTANYDRRIH